MSGVGLGGVILATGTLGQYDRAMQSIGYGLLAFVFGGLLIAASEAGDATALRRILTNRILRYIGARSYALYVIHPIIVMLLFRVWFNRVVASSSRDLVWQLIFWIFAAALSILAAEASWQVLEKRCLALKRFFPRFD